MFRSAQVPFCRSRPKQKRANSLDERSSPKTEEDEVLWASQHSQLAEEQVKRDVRDDMRLGRMEVDRLDPIGTGVKHALEV